MRFEVRQPLRVFHRPFRVLARGASLRRRVAYSLAIVRLILVPVIILAVYYLFAMAGIVDRIVSVEAPVATLAERTSQEMMDARRAERNYFLLHDPADLQANHQSLAQLRDLVGSIRDLEPAEGVTAQKILDQTNLYQQRLNDVVKSLGQPRQAPVDQVQQVVSAYEKDLNELLKRARRGDQAGLVDQIRDRVNSFDAQITATVETADPSVRQASVQLEDSSSQVIQLASDLEKRSWERVQLDHQKARELKRRAEWVLCIVSVLVFLLSVWVSFVLPREVVSPLVDLKAAVDHAAAGNYEIEFDVQGEGEVVQLANSVRNLIAHVRDKQETASLARKR
jgi:CHASE3 domain sensor protein